MHAIAKPVFLRRRWRAGEMLWEQGEPLTRFQPMSIHFQLVPDPVPVNACWTFLFFFSSCDKAHRRLMSPAGWRRLLSLLSSSDGPSPSRCLSLCLSVFQLMAAYTKQRDPASMTSATRWMAAKPAKPRLPAPTTSPQNVSTCDGSGTFARAAALHGHRCRITWHSTTWPFRKWCPAWISIFIWYM